MTELILAVCTGNISRSPFVERMLAATVQTDRWRFASAGTHAMVGAPMDAKMADRLVRLGGSPDGFRARQLDRAILADVGLVIGLERAHRSAVLAARPELIDRTFTLVELSRLLNEITVDPGEPLAAAVSRARQARSARQVADPRLDDIDDPYGRGRRAYDRAAEAMMSGVTQLARALQALSG